jgi:hypothetical protein
MLVFSRSQRLCFAECESANVPFVLLFFLLSLGLVYIFHLLSQSTAPDSAITIYFAQCLVLFLGSDFSAFLSIFNANLLNNGTALCILPLSSMARLLSGLYMPLVSFALLALVAASDRALRSPRCRVRLPARCLRALPSGEWQSAPWIRTVCALLLFSCKHFACADPPRKRLLLHSRADNSVANTAFSLFDWCEPSSALFARLVDSLLVVPCRLAGWLCSHAR